MFGRSWGGPAGRNVNRRTMHHLSRREFAATLGAAALARADTSEDLAGLTVSAAASKIRASAITSTQLVSACLERIAIVGWGHSVNSVA